MHPPLNVEAGGIDKKGGSDERGGSSPPFACRGHFLILKGFIDPRILAFNDIHRPHPGPQENMQIGGVRCAISQIWPKFREIMGKHPADIHL